MSILKSAIHIISLLILFLLATAQCKDDDTQIFRAYAEGTISYSDAKLLQDPIHLVKDGKIIAETYPKDNGNFVLAGPYDKGIYKLQLKQYKIKSFSTETKGCRLSADSLAIEIPDGVTYVIFNNIELK